MDEYWGGLSRVCIVLRDHLDKLLRQSLSPGSIQNSSATYCTTFRQSSYYSSALGEPSMRSAQMFLSLSCENISVIMNHGEHNQVWLELGVAKWRVMRKLPHQSQNIDMPSLMCHCWCVVEIPIKSYKTSLSHDPYQVCVSQTTKYKSIPRSTIKSQKVERQWYLYNHCVHFIKLFLLRTNGNANSNT